jgi:glycosyltransferase involved in cell wall biosynthesis
MAVADPRLRYWRCPVNGGPAVARNGRWPRRGSWIAVVDSDDMIHPDGWPGC